MTLTSLNGGTFYKPLFFEFPNDSQTYFNQELYVMLGSALKLNMMTNTLNMDQTWFYHPPGTWCDVFNQNGVEGCHKFESGTYAPERTLAYDFKLQLR